MENKKKKVLTDFLRNYSCI